MHSAVGAGEEIAEFAAGRSMLAQRAALAVQTARSVLWRRLRGAERRLERGALCARPSLHCARGARAFCPLTTTAAAADANPWRRTASMSLSTTVASTSRNSLP